MKKIKNTIALLRFPFSIFLLPVSLFSFFFIQPPIQYPLFLVLGVWHLLVFPSSNGYNSYHDRDEGPIGGLANPPQPTRFLLYLSNGMDIGAIALSFFVNPSFAFFVTCYIFASRLYSNRKVRLKKFPITAFLIVFIFQGAWVFCANILALSSGSLFSDMSLIYSCIASSFLVATIYPLTQLYQHENDRKDGVKTLSMMLGIKGTFMFSALAFSFANLFIFLSFHMIHRVNDFLLFNGIMLPSTIYFLIWALRTFHDPIHANFKNTMVMLILSTLLNNLYFLILLIK